jgi:hypothetical protein
MSNSTYTINKGISRSIEFKGLKAQYIWWLAGGAIVLMILFAIAFALGLNAYSCLALGLGLATALVTTIFRLSHKYGEFGMMKKMAQRSAPRHIRARSRTPFTKLNSDHGKDMDR